MVHAVDNGFPEFKYRTGRLYTFRARGIGLGLG